MMRMTDPDRPTPSPALVLLSDALRKSEDRYAFNRSVRERRGERPANETGYIDVTITTSNATTHDGRIFSVHADEPFLALHHYVSRPEQSERAEITYVNAAAIETMQITFTFEDTFEVAISRADLDAILDRLNDTAGACDGDMSEKISAAIREAINVLRGNAISETLELAERAWRRFKDRTLVPVTDADDMEPRVGWYFPKGADQPQYGEIAFQHLFSKMPSDFLYAETHDKAKQALKNTVRSPAPQ